MPSFEGEMQKAENLFDSKSIALSRRDIILICILVNIALLAILFATSNQIAKSKPTEILQSSLYTIDELKPHVVPVVKEVKQPVCIPQKPVDEIDAILQEYAKRSEQIKKVELTANTQVPKQEEFLLIQVKEGDVISKLAKQYGVKQSEILKVNNLVSSRLKVGQVLKVPKRTQDVAAANPVPVPAPSQIGQFYTVKAGDNPWTIARRFNLDFDELCQLNDLDEDKAKNLKIGQKIRIK